MRRLNVRLLLMLAVGLLVCGGAVHAIHFVQVRRQAGAFLREAQRAEESQKQFEASDLLRKYLLLKPEDTEAMARLGKLLFDQRRMQEAQGILGQVVLRESDRDESRRMLVDASIALGRFQDARSHLVDHLLKLHPEEAELWFKLGTCQHGLDQHDDRSDKELAGGSIPSARQCYLRAIEKDPALTACYIRLASLILERKRDDKTIEGDPNILDPLEAMIQRNEGNADAYLARSSFLKAFSGDRRFLEDASKKLASTEGADPSAEVRKLATQDAKKAFELKPDDPTVLRFAAESALSEDRLDEARELAQKALDKEPKNPASYFLLSSIEQRGNEREKAADYLTRGLEATANDPLLLISLAGLQLELNKVDQARQLIDRLPRNESTRPISAYLQARVLIAESRWYEARQQLEGIGADFSDRSQLQRDVQFWLGYTHEKLGMSQAALAAYRAAIEVDPEWPVARLAAAEILMTKGRRDEALSELRRARQLPGAPPQSRIAELRASTLQMSRRPRAEQDWKDINKDVDALVASASGVDALLLKAQALVAQQRHDDARKLLDEALSKNSSEPAVWTGLVALAAQREDWETAEKTLDEMRGKVGDIVPYRLAKAAYIVRRRPESAAKELRALCQLPPDAKKEDIANLARRMAGFAVAAGDFKLAEELCRTVAEIEPHDLSIRLMLFDLTWQAKDSAAIDKALEEVRRIERDGPFTRYGEALLLAVSAKQDKDDAKFDAALKKLEDARRHASDWPRIPLLTAEILDEKAVKAVQAAGQLAHEETIQLFRPVIEQYQQAFSLGERNPRMLERFVRLLNEVGDYATVNATVRKLQQEQAEFSVELSRGASLAAIQTKDWELTAELARKTGSQALKPEDRFWRGQMLRISRKFAEAEAEFKKLISETPAEPAGWIGLVGCYVEQGKKDQAMLLIADMKKGKLNPEKLALASAAAYGVIGDIAEMERELDAALRSDPKNARLRLAFADFKRRDGKTKEAETILQEMLADKVEDVDSTYKRAARQQLALLWASIRDYPNYQKARDLIEENLRAEGADDEDRRVLANVLASFPTASNIDEAMKTLDELLRKYKILSSEDRFVLARLYVAKGQAGKALEQLRALAETDEPRYVASFAEALIAQRSFSEAETWLSKLDELRPGDYRTIDLRVRFLAHPDQKRYGEALELLVSFVAKIPGEDAGRAALHRAAAARAEAIAAELQAAGNQEAARPFFARAEEWLAAVSPPEQAANPDRLRLFVRSGRYADALDEFDKVRGKATEKDVAAMCVALSLIDSTESQLEDRIDRSLAEQAAKSSNVAVWLALAAFQDRTGRYGNAEESYRRVLALDGGNIMALNNLAFLIAVQKKNLQDAVSLIDKAVSAAGPIGTLLDTRSVVRLASGRKDEAVADAEAAVKEDPAAIHYFHLARALHASGQPDKALDAWKKARGLNLNAEALHRLEADDFRNLEEEFRKVNEKAAAPQP